MFQRLTSLFFSDSNTPEGLEEPKPFVEEEEEEDGWLIIDLAGEKSREDWFPAASAAPCLLELGKPLEMTADELPPHVISSALHPSSPGPPTPVQPPTCSCYFPVLSQWCFPLSASVGAAAAAVPVRAAATLEPPDASTAGWDPGTAPAQGFGVILPTSGLVGDANPQGLSACELWQ